MQSAIQNCDVEGILTDLDDGLSHLSRLTPLTAVGEILLSPRLVSSSPHIGRVSSPLKRLRDARGLPCCRDKKMKEESQLLENGRKEREAD